MTCELTKNGLLDYFGADVVEKILELPLVQRHISALDYRECQAIFSDSEKRQIYQPKKNADFKHSLLGMEQLKVAPLDEILKYLSIEPIREAYLQHYNEYFLLFEERIFSLKSSPALSDQSLPFLLDTVNERKLILLVKGSMGTPLAAFNNALFEQNALLEQLQSQFVAQASRAERFVAAIRGENLEYKQTVVSLAFSVAKIGLNIINVGELIEVSKALATLATSSFEKIETALPSLIKDIKHLVVNNHFYALQEAENKLLSTTASEAIRHSWEMYRTQVLLNANKSIKEVLTGCIDNDDFIRCVIKEILGQERELTLDTLFIAVAQRASKYIEEIVKTLQSRVAIIRQVAEAACSSEGSQKIEEYYKRIGLIDYTLQHEKTGNGSQNWLTKRLGHRLSAHFPHEVFQKKWSSPNLTHLLFGEITYAKEKHTLEQYRTRRKEAIVVLGLFRNSSKTRDSLFETLEEKIPDLGDELIEALSGYHASPASGNQYSFALSPVDTNKRRYSFKQRRSSLFNNSPFSTPSTSPSSSPSGSPMSTPKLRGSNTPILQRSSGLHQVRNATEFTNFNC